MNTKTHFINTIFVTAVFVLSCQIVGRIIDPIQSLLLTTGYASIFFAPHSIRVHAVFLYSPGPASLYLLIASLVSLTFSDSSMDQSAVTVALQALTGAFCAPVAYQLLKFSFGSDHISLGSVNARTWRGILMVIIVSSLLNGLFQTISIGLGDTGVAVMLLSFKYTVGDILGAIFVLFVANYLLRKAIN